MNAEIVCPQCSTPNPVTKPFCQDCGTELKLFNQRYLVIKEVGSGGFGTVYKVQDIQQPDDGIFAIKKLNFGVNDDKQGKVNKFIQEALMLLKLTHPNLPHIYDFFIDKTDYYLIMDFIEGKTLSEYIDKQPAPILPTSKAVTIGIELASVLDYLHNQNPPIIFRDLNPNNIMLTSAGKLYLIDFGIAHYLKPGKTKNTENLGTYGYISPEHYSLATHLADIYSLGAILYGLLSGQDPADFPRFQFPELQLRGVPQAKLGKLVMSMVEYNHQNRPTSAAIVKQQLQQILQDLQSSTGTTRAKPQPTAKSAPPNRVLPQPAVQLSRGEPLHTNTHHSGAIYALAWSPDGKLLASAGEDCQVCISEALTGKAVFTYQQQHTASVRALAWSPNSKYVASAGNDRTVQIWQAQDGREFSTYREHRRWVQALSWSPDAKLIASGDASGQIHLWNPRNGQRQSIYRQHHASLHALGFSPDGALIVSGDEDNSLYVWESSSLSLRATYTGHQKGISALAWSPDGTRLASSSEDRKDHTLHIWQATTGTQVATYTPHERMINALAWSPDGQSLASASRDQTVYILDPQTGDSLFTYHGHTSSVNALAWSPDGNYLASASEDGQVQVWWAK